MFRIPLVRLRTRPRKYPIKRDEYGKSTRRRCFDLFDKGTRPAEAGRTVGVSLRTACRYFADWKQLPKNLRIVYTLIKAMIKSNSQSAERMKETLADHCGISVEQVAILLQKPWGLRQLLTGKWLAYHREEILDKSRSKLQAALQLIEIIEQSGMTPDELDEELDRLMKKAKAQAD